MNLKAIRKFIEENNIGNKKQPEAMLPYSKILIKAETPKGPFALYSVDNPFGKPQSMGSVHEDRVFVLGGYNKKEAEGLVLFAEEIGLNAFEAEALTAELSANDAVIEQPKTKRMKI